MNLYEIKIPLNKNDGTPQSWLVTQWENYLANRFGGFTRGLTESGAWRDPRSGTVQREPVIPYQVATPGDAEFGSLLAREALRIFDDQHSIFVAKTGTAIIVERERAAA